MNLLTAAFTPNQAFQSHFFTFLAKSRVHGMCYVLSRMMGCTEQTRVLHSSTDCTGRRNPLPVHVVIKWEQRHSCTDEKYSVHNMQKWN